MASALCAMLPWQGACRRSHSIASMELTKTSSQWMASPMWFAWLCGSDLEVSSAWHQFAVPSPLPIVSTLSARGGTLLATPGVPEHGAQLGQPLPLYHHMLAAWSCTAHRIGSAQPSSIAHR